MAQQISQVLPALRVVDSLTEQPQSSTVSLQKLDLAKLPRRLNDTMLAELEAAAKCPVPPPQPCPEARFLEVFIVLDACLPRQTDDGLSGKLRTAAYRRMLGGYSYEAIKHLEATALTRCRWFPTIAECLDILRSFTPRNQLGEKRTAVLRRINAERTTRFDEAMHRLANEDVPQDWLDALPETWKVHAETRSLIWFNEDGSCSQRGRGRA